MTAVDTKIVIFGGRKKENAEGDLNDLWEFDTETNTWLESNPGKEPPSAIKMTWQHVGIMSKVVNRFRK